MRNPSKNTIKKLLNKCWMRDNYWFHNIVGAKVSIVSKGKINNLMPHHKVNGKYVEVKPPYKG